MYLGLLQFWRSEVHKRSHWAKIKVLAGLVPSGSCGGEPVFWPFPASRSHLHSLAYGSLPYSKAAIVSGVFLTWYHSDAAASASLFYGDVVTLGPPG